MAEADANTLWLTQKNKVVSACNALIIGRLDRKMAMADATDAKKRLYSTKGQVFMTAVELLAECQARDIQVSVQGASLAYDAPAGALTPEVIEAMRQHKAALLALLERWEERAAILEYDAGLPRDDAEWQAYLCGKGGQHVPQ
jgi:hypothetical protein